ncbi:hypothetical protein N9B82_06585 [Saprospiraceae bacterium]|nr:hypothetical protein [Saprospiraceae bacterium]
MASSLNIIANHKIEFDSPEYVIEQFGNSLNIELLEGNRRDLHSLPQTDNFDEAKFYVSAESLGQNFEKWKHVEVLSNYKPLHNFKIFCKTIQIFTNILVKYWRPLLEQEPFNESLSKQFEHTSKNWSLIEESTKTIISKLKGSQIVFLSDDYENISDLCYASELHIQNLIEILTKNYSSTQLKWIKGNDMKKRLRYNWLNLIVDENQVWKLDPNID